MTRTVSVFSSSCSNAVWATDDDHQHQPRAAATATDPTGRDARARWASMLLPTNDSNVEALKAEALPSIRLGATSRLFLQRQLGITDRSNRPTSSASNSRHQIPLPHASSSSSAAAVYARGDGGTLSSLKSNSTLSHPSPFFLPSSSSCSLSTSSGLQHPLLRARRRLGKVVPQLVSTSKLPHPSPFSLPSSSYCSVSTSYDLHPLLQSRRRLGEVAPHLVSTSELARHDAHANHQYANAGATTTVSSSQRAASSNTCRILELFREEMDAGQEDEDMDKKTKHDTTKTTKHTHALSCDKLVLYSNKRRRLLYQHHQHRRHHHNGDDNKNYRCSSSSFSTSMTCSSSYNNNNNNNMFTPSSSAPSLSSSSSLQVSQYYRSVFTQVLNRKTSS
jgi:hypothetical protein